MRRLVASATDSRVSIEVAAKFAFSTTKNPQQPVDKVIFPLSVAGRLTPSDAFEVPWMSSLI
jgi:hypothetical protein